MFSLESWELFGSTEETLRPVLGMVRTPAREAGDSGPRRKLGLRLEAFQCVLWVGEPCGKPQYVRTEGPLVAGTRIQSRLRLEGRGQGDLPIGCCHSRGN